VNWRAEEIARERDADEREQYRTRKLMTREERLAEVDAMVESGSLTVRNATPAECARFGITPAAEEVVTTVTISRDAVGEPGMDELAGMRTSSQRAAAIVQRSEGVPAGTSAAELASSAGVSLRTVERALRVQEADAVLFQSMLAGKLSATAADKAIR
jgi:hypothetical protein